MFRLENVSKEYQGIAALSGLSFSVSKNELIGVVGKSGSGKSTLLRLLNMMEPPTAGKLFIYGNEVQQFSKKMVMEQKQKTGMVFQQYNLISNKTVLENVALPLRLLKQKNTEKAMELLKFVGLADKQLLYPAQLSGGEKQRVAIARALVRHPEVLLCDEATSSLDEENTVEVLQLLQAAHQTFSTTIIFVSHDLNAVKQLCQRILVLEKGKLTEEIRHRPRMEELLKLSYTERVRRSVEA